MRSAQASNCLSSSAKGDSVGGGVWRWAELLGVRRFSEEREVKGAATMLSEPFGPLGASGDRGGVARGTTVEGSAVASDDG